MLDIVLVIMIVFFLIFLMVNLYADNPVFGVIASFWLIIIALAIIVDGIQLRAGETIVTLGGNITISYTYSDLVLPFPSGPGIIFGITLIGIGVYMLYKNAEML